MSATEFRPVARRLAPRIQELGFIGTPRLYRRIGDDVVCILSFQTERLPEPLSPERPTRGATHVCVNTGVLVPEIAEFEYRISAEVAGIECCQVRDRPMSPKSMRGMWAGWHRLGSPSLEASLRWMLDNSVREFFDTFGSRERIVRFWRKHCEFPGSNDLLSALHVGMILWFGGDREDARQVLRDLVAKAQVEHELFGERLLRDAARLGIRL